MTTTVELVIVPSADTIGACVFVHHQRRSYVFGRVGEGVQRAFGTRKIRFGGTEHVFLSGPVGWDQAGGLLGYLLSIGTAIESAQEQVAQENETRRQKGLKPRPAPDHSGITVHGGDNLCHLLAAHRPVIMRQAVQVYTIEQRADPRAVNTGPLDPDWEDDALRVWKIPVQRACSPIPPKRRHSVLDETDTRVAAPSRSPPSTSSDPDVASAIVERYMFRDDESSSYTVARRAGQLDPSDVAFFKENGALRLYRHPATAGGRTTIDQNRIVWTYPRPADKPPRPASRPETLAAIKHQPLPPASYSRLSMSYIVKCHDRRGKFNPIAAAELGVLRENFKVLARGQSVKGKDGTTVTPDMVLGEMQPGMGIVIADVPGHDFVDAFIQRPEWKQADLMRHIVAMYWILRPGLSQDARIHAFIQQHAQIKHVFCASDTCPNMITHPGPAELQVQLRRIDQQRFPLLNFDNTVRYPEPPPGSPIELGRAGEKMRLMPRALLGIQAAAPFANLTVASQAIKTHVLQLAQKARAEVSDTEFLARVAEANRDIPNQDAEVVPLGTGSSTPNKYRNVASTLVLVPGIGNYLLDCGEGTLGQMRRGFGPEDTAAILGKLRCIVISHLHADHHLGLISVVRAWYEQALQDGSTATLAVSCTQRYCQMLQELAQVEDFGFHRLRFPSCSARTRAATDGDGGDCGDVNLTTTADLGADNFGLASIQRVPVRHCWRSYATQLELTSGLRIAYSGDCRPSAAFASACRGAHLLVHECTFDDKHVDAVAKRHSTMSEALAVARDMGARRTLLTHFSQRYFRAESIWRSPQAASAAATDARHAVLLAWDLMRVRLGDFHLAARYVPAVQAHMESLGDAPADTSGTIAAGS